MQLDYDGRQYEMQWGSDLKRDGSFQELWDISQQPAELVLFAFWCDADSRFTFHAYREELPFDLVETFVQTARERVPPMTQTDGT